jgi:hypothetical protein
MILGVVQADRRRPSRRDGGFVLPAGLTARMQFVMTTNSPMAT